MRKIQDEIEKIIWQGDDTSGVGNLAMFDGLLIPTGSFTDCNTTAYDSSVLTALEIGDMVEAIQRVYAITPSAAAAQPDFKIFVGLDKFRLLAAALTKSGNGLTSGGGQLASYQSDFDPFRMVYPGTNIEVIGVNGLTGHNGVYGASLSNLVLGLDLEEDSSNLEVWYSSKDNRTIRVACEFIMGTQVAYPDQVGKVAV